jgi:signal transduction histidine kinase
VLNLIKNGLEALSRDGTMSVTTRRLDDTVDVAVSDTGPGIPPEVGRRLFEQFFTTKPQGTGLGLSITRQIAEGARRPDPVDQHARRGRHLHHLASHQEDRHG